MNRLFVVQNVFREVFDDDALVIGAATSHKDIDGWDSVAQVKIVLALEEEFGFRFSEDEVSEIRTVGQLLKAIEKYTDRTA